VSIVAGLFVGAAVRSVAIIDATIPLKSKADWPVRNEIESAAFERVAKFFK